MLIRNVKYDNVLMVIRLQMSSSVIGFHNNDATSIITAEYSCH